MISADCPACGAKVILGLKPRLGQRFLCKECKTEVEVVWLDPIELDWPYDDDEEYDEADDWDEEDL
jgi:lysine biosynthesis protein LysW